MNEFEKLLNQISYLMDDIIYKKKAIDEKNDRHAKVKESINKIVDLINDKKLGEINLDNIIFLLKDLVSDADLKEIIQKLKELIGMQAFLSNDKITNPLKQLMLTDLSNIGTSLTNIVDNIPLLKESSEDAKLMEECQKYLEFINENGFTMVLTSEERKAFYKFLKRINYDDSLSIIASYIAYANKNMKVPEKTIPKVVPEETKEEVKANPNPEKPKNEYDYDEILEKVNDLIEMHQSEITEEDYNKYKDMYSRLDIYQIYSLRSDFITIDGVDWKKAIPCIKEGLLPNIKSRDKNLIFRLFNELIIFNEKAIEEYRQTKKEQNIYREKLEEFKQKLVTVDEKYHKMSTELDKITDEVSKKVNNKGGNIESLIKTVEKNEEGTEEYIKFYDVNYEDLKIYELNTTIKSKLSDIKTYIEFEMLSEEEFKYIYKLLNEVSVIIEECNKYYDEFMPKKGDTEEIVQAPTEQNINTHKSKDSNQKI